MKALAIALSLALACVPVLLPGVAAAGTLVAGAVRDTDGYAVAGARLDVAAADGGVVGRGTTGSDGTFAIDAGGVPATLEVRCSFCVAKQVRLTGEPAAVVVVRFAALRDRSPSVDDVAALPYGRAADVAALVPYAVVSARGISDRGLGTGQGAVLVDGISFYRPTNGGGGLELLPQRSMAALAAQPANASLLYGQYAQGGTFDFATLGETGAEARAGGAGASAALRFAGPSGAAALDESTGGGVLRRASGQVSAPLAGGTFSLLATAAGGLSSAASGVALRYAAGLPRFDADASFTASTSRITGAYGTLISAADTRTDVHLRGRGPAAVEVGVRLQQSTGADGPTTLAGSQSEAALYADARSTGSWATVLASVAVQHETARLGGPQSWEGTAILPALDAEHRFGDHFAVRASMTAGLRTAYLLQLAPYAYANAAPFVRSTIVDGTLSYTDERRLRIDGVAYAEHSADAAGRITGFGINAAWQLTPQIALRSWALAAFAGADEDAPLGFPYAAYPSGAAPLRRQVAWITYRHGIRIDVLTHGSGVDASAGIPLGRATTLVAGTFGAPQGRVVTLGLRFP